MGVYVEECFDADDLSGGAICGTFIVFGGLSVLLYGPWRRRVDRKRARNAHFEPFSQSTVEALATEEAQFEDADTRKGKQVSSTTVEPVSSTDAAGPVGVAITK
jgi:high-affinity nickel-transport protein